jgi:hypothetical protein
MSEEVEVLTRATAIPNNTDPQGRIWKIKFNRGSALLSAEPEPFRENFQCPAEMKGRYTSTKVLQEAITLYLNRAWDAADKAAVKAERKAQAKKEGKVSARSKKTEEPLPAK